MIREHRIGTMVEYTLNGLDAEDVNNRIDTKWPHVGNKTRAGDVFPMLITRVWQGDHVNGQVFLDGNFILWVTSVKEGAGQREFRYAQDVAHPLDAENKEEDSE